MMTDEEFAARLKALAKMSDMDKEEKKENKLFIAAACDTEERDNLICEYLMKDGITFESLIDYVDSISPRVEIVDDDDYDYEEE